jgi:hypothetical protein
MRYLTSLFGALALAALAAGAAPALAAHRGEAERPERVGEKINLVKGQEGTRLIGHAVKSRSGRVLGKLADLGIASGADQELYAVISLGGVLGIGPRRVAVPFSEIDTSHADYLVFTGEPESLKDRPLFRHTGSRR